MLVSRLHRAVHIGGVKRVCHQIFSLAHRDAFRSAYRCSLFAAFCETRKRLQHIQNAIHTNEVFALPAAEKAFAAMILNARWWRQPRYHRTAGLHLNPFANFAGSLRGSQKFAGSLRGLHKGCRAGTVDGIKKVIHLYNSQLEDTVTYGSPVTPAAVPASPHDLCVFAFLSLDN